MFATGRIRPTGGSILRRVDVLHLEHTAADVEIALWIWNFDVGFAQMFVDQEIQIALEPPRPITHFHAPDHELEMSYRPRRFKSDLNFLIDKHLRKADIEIPNPQRDLHIRSGVLKLQNVDAAQDRSASRTDSSRGEHAR